MSLASSASGSMIDDDDEGSGSEVSNSGDFDGDDNRSDESGDNF